MAQICLRRYGKSPYWLICSAKVSIRTATPPRYLLGLTLEQFQQLPSAEQKQHRQRAKAINFGVPGGLGAASLVSYAKHAYGVALTIEQARGLPPAG